MSSSGKSSVASTSMRSARHARSSASSRCEKAPASERAGGARRRFGAGVDQVGHGLGLRQVELAVEEGALGEFARLGQAQPGIACRQRASSSCSTTGPPCACSSSTSSPVYECGAGKWMARPRSMVAVACHERAVVAWRGRSACGRTRRGSAAPGRGRTRAPTAHRARARGRWRWRRWGLGGGAGRRQSMAACAVTRCRMVHAVAARIRRLRFWRRTAQPAPKSTGQMARVEGQLRPKSMGPCRPPEPARDKPGRPHACIVGPRAGFSTPIAGHSVVA
jgi:hypothetical protein